MKLWLSEVITVLPQINAEIAGRRSLVTGIILHTETGQEIATTKAIPTLTSIMARVYRHELQRPGLESWVWLPKDKITFIGLTISVVECNARRIEPDLASVVAYLARNNLKGFQ